MFRRRVWIYPETLGNPRKPTGNPFKRRRKPPRTSPTDGRHGRTGRRAGGRTHGRTSRTDGRHGRYGRTDVTCLCLFASTTLQNQKCDLFISVDWLVLQYTELIRHTFRVRHNSNFTFNHCVCNPVARAPTRARLQHVYAHPRPDYVIGNSGGIMMVTHKNNVLAAG